MKQFFQGTTGNLVEYLQDLVDQGLMTNGQIAPLKSAITTVMSAAEGDGWVQSNVFDVDVDDLMRRFIDRTPTKYSEQSLSAYKSRVGRALSWYKRHLDDPEWKPVMLDSAWSQHHAKYVRNNSYHNGKTGFSISSIKRGSLADDTKSQMISYPFPLRAGQIAQLNLPMDLTKEEAQRLAVFINSVVWREKGDEM